MPKTAKNKPSERQNAILSFIEANGETGSGNGVRSHLFLIQFNHAKDEQG